MFHTDPESNKAIIRSLLRKTVQKLKARRHEVERSYALLQTRLDLLTLHETDPDQYEEMLDELEEPMKIKQYKLDVINEIIRRKTND